MPRKSVFEMGLSKLYQALVNKAERKGRTREEVDQVTCWLLGYTPDELRALIAQDIPYGKFLSNAPQVNERADLITGTICGVRVETIEDPLTKRMRQLDKLVDEIARGKAMDKILRA